MTIQLTEDQWEKIKSDELPVRVSDPAQSATFVLVRAEVYERFKSLFEEDPVTEQERMFQLQQFGERAGWDDPEMAIYDELVGLLNRAERVARLVKVPNCGSGCRGFESRHSPNTSPCEVTTYKGLLFAFPAWAGQTAPGNHPAVSMGGKPAMFVGGDNSTQAPFDRPRPAC